jgi:hypothetical protein
MLKTAIPSGTVSLAWSPAVKPSNRPANKKDKEKRGRKENINDENIRQDDQTG